MTELELRAPVGIGTSFVQQLRLLGWSGRWAWLTLGLLFLLAAVRTMQDGAPSQMPLLLMAAMFSLPAPVLWAFLVWHGELPDRRAYHWSLPVARPAHDLARVAVGAVWLLVAYAALAGAAALLAATSGEWAQFAAIRTSWAGFFAGPLALYLNIMPFALWSDSQTLRRLMGGFVAVGMISIALDMTWWRSAMVAVFGERWGLTTAVFGGLLRPADAGSVPPSATLLWIAIGLVGTIAAATWRPAELARLLRRR